MGNRRARDKALRQLARLTGEHGRSLRSDELPPMLYNELLHHFGTIAEARRAAKVPEHSRSRKWTEQTVVSEVRRLHGRGVLITEASLVDHDRYDLVGAIHSVIGSIVRVRRLARVPDPPRPRFEKETWDADRVISEILERHEDGEPVAASKVPRNLLKAGRRYFGSWGDAIAAAGLDYASACLRKPRYDDAELADALRELADARPDMTQTELRRHPVGAAACRRHGTLDVAITAAGLNHWPRRERRSLMTKPETIAALQARARRGQKVHRYAIEQADLHLWNSIKRNFDSLAAALRAARVALTPPPPSREWTRTEITRELSWRRKHGLPLTAAEIRGELPGLYQAARREYGGYYAIAKRFGAVSSRPRRR